MKSAMIGALHNAGYGASELSEYYQRYMSRSLFVSIVLQLGLFTLYDGFRDSHGQFVAPNTWTHFPPVRPIQIPYVPVGSSPFARAPGVRSLAGLKFAIPMPIPDDVADSSQTFPAQSEHKGSMEGDAGLDGLGSGDIGSGEITGPSEDNVEPPPFRPVEKVPEIVKRVEAKYPEIAVRSGIEGMVTVNVWVDKTGKVRKAEVLKSTSEIFAPAAKEAAMKWIFTPAIMNREPVSVWVSIPFRFRLRTR